jgi:hypothetical protein
VDEKRVFILWRGERGTYRQDPPGVSVIASTISETALKSLAADHRVFVLELSKDRENIEIVKL